MLVNSKNQVVRVSPHLNTKTHGHVFAHLREKLEPTPRFVGKMFCIENRVKVKG